MKTISGGAAAILDTLTASTTRAVGAMQSATVFINGYRARLEAAVAAALENGATAQELAPIQAEVDALDQESANIAAAIAANP